MLPLYCPACSDPGRNWTNRFCGVEPVPGPTSNQVPPVLTAEAVKLTGVFGSVLVKEMEAVNDEAPCCTVWMPKPSGMLTLSSEVLLTARVTMIGRVAAPLPLL